MTMVQSVTSLSRPKITDLFDRLSKAYPNPTTALDYEDGFQLLVAVVLSAQTTDKAVNQVTPALFADAPNPKAMAAYGEEAIAGCIKSLGLYRSKARHVHQLAQKLVTDFDERVPDSRDDLQSLPGVGRKTASVVLNVLFGQPTVAVDTHVFRLANRMGLALAKTPVQVEAILERVIPKDHLQMAHHYLIYHGREVCHARRPRCTDCVLADLCPSASNF